jgi:hypothetical protein
MAKSKEVSTCKLVFMKNGALQECGGEIEEKKIHRPFSSHTVFGGPAPPPLFIYGRCKKCHAMYDYDDRH